ncbi:MAG: EscU/YscU/HrcU family type III secretion system export apparatus switch protein [Aquificota bacterium]|nr:EscU/YscU/HrcU family type III secretion system export apparatus switch protein [Aquificota bacterium]
MRGGKDRAPLVWSPKGVGELAEKIVELARKEGVPILEDKPLIEALLRVEVFEEIPPVLYEAVAKVLVFVQEVRKRSSQR